LLKKNKKIKAGRYFYLSQRLESEGYFSYDTEREETKKDDKTKRGEKTNLKQC